MTEKYTMTAKQLREARVTLGLSQAALAKELGKSERFVVYRESGEEPIDNGMQYAICWLLIPAALRDLWVKTFFG